jgi:hypothetical protein
MKSNIRNFAIAAFAALVSLSPAMHAQVDYDSVRVHVPFSFDYGTKHFAQGVYTITRSGAVTLIIRCGADAAMAIVDSGYDPAPRQTSQVIFRKYGDRYFLQEVQMANGDEITLSESQAEKSAARELARRGSQPTTLALAVLPDPIAGN